MNNSLMLKCCTQREAKLDTFLNYCDYFCTFKCIKGMKSLHIFFHGDLFLHDSIRSCKQKVFLVVFFLLDLL